LSLQSEIKQLNFNKTIEERKNETSKISQEINKIEEILNN
jgi:hypothetical protein